MTAFNNIAYRDSGSLDAFTRLRVSSPEILFSVQQQYNSGTVQLESGNTGTGVAPAYDTNTRMTALSCTAGSGTSFIQSFLYTPYEPGHSQFFAGTFVIGTGVAGATVDVGYFDANNGIFLRQNGVTNLQFILRTSTSGSVSDSNAVAQASWNIDPLNGSGPSGKTLDITKSQIMVMDLQYLGMGRVRVGFDIDGSIYYAHQFLNANTTFTTPYMQSGTLPFQMVVTASSTATTKTSYFKCATIMNEGGAIEKFGYSFSTPETTATAGNGARVPLVSVRPKTTFNGITNRELFVLEGISILNTGANDVLWELVVGGAYGGQSFSDVNTTYSAFEYSSTPGTFTNLTGGIVISAGYVSKSANGQQVANIATPHILSMKYPITLDRSGAVRALGTLTLLVTGVQNTSTVRGCLNFREVR